MGKWNEEAAPNNNLPPIKSLNDVGKHEFSEELSDGGERNKAIEQLQKDKKLT
ncbi:hypothetical protein MXL46_04025 [Heyndrickxia sporothermodurans]|uniref:Uncharacterized protein n=1 Tax=Heyndrickxia sporothermodurans TaxID=46224 RepID=A0A150KQH0_9BACI|nr:hypothetical protein [Heyndrickxia sporothermodurans]KYD00095.1 hypothetical protein B4102_1107 [Heyndrickxia sporothermodurans]MBL5769281.1 hypothetical protein [Heyndrickxia sporothermodurans]MBL5772168.1 hypothetical protein [Heyndrickxia sporothermodurans]MBL5775731.1 hypothetical protein [Heyndrickxia sporothermodurans]MBL5779307.1 hypothetical protein [Heyndrickxia sporothermodurans]